MDWISVDTALPTSWNINVIVTDGSYIAIAYYIHDPEDWGCSVRLEEDEEETKRYRNCLEKKPHWHFSNGRRYSDMGDEMLFLADLDDVTHWMPFPKIPK